MSLLTPQTLPVKVYKWDDVGAPVLNRSAGCMMAIFKACLVTGYGTKAAAGWSLAFEDVAAKVSALRPEQGANIDFFLRLSADNGTQVVPQVYLNMTDASTGNLKLQCDSPFKYGQGIQTNKWLLIATSRGFWFFNEQRNAGDANKTGSYFFVGDLARSNTSDRPVYLQHTGGSFDNAFFSSIFGVYQNIIQKDTNTYLYGKLLLSDAATVEVADIRSLTNGWKVETTESYISDCCVIAGNDLYAVPAIYAPFSGAKYNNFDVVTIDTSSGSHQAIVFGTSATASTNTYFTTDEWVY